MTNLRKTERILASKSYLHGKYMNDWIVDGYFRVSVDTDRYSLKRRLEKLYKGDLFTVTVTDLTRNSSYLNGKLTKIIPID